MAQRGSYAKGVAKREEILTRALEVIAREGYRGASVKQLARAVGLSQAGLLHYFESKEELFTAIVRKRDEIDQLQFASTQAETQAEVQTEVQTEDLTLAELRAGFLQVIRHNSDIPGVVELFSRLSVDAADIEHPAHRYFLDRGTALRERFTTAAARAQAEGALPDDLDPATFARIFQAVADGLQLQWMLEPDVDMSATIDALFTALGAVSREDAGGGDRTVQPGPATAHES